MSFPKNRLALPFQTLSLCAVLSTGACYYAGGPQQGWSGAPVEAPPPPPPVVVEAPPPPKMKGAKLEIMGEIEFAVGKAIISDTPASQDVLNQVLKIMKATPGLTKLRVEGHTDSSGRAADNQKLSAARATAVGAWLTDKGIDAGRLTMDGCGSRVPVVKNDSPAHMAMNRRTEFHVVELDGQKPDGYTESCTPDAPAKP